MDDLNRLGGYAPGIIGIAVLLYAWIWIALMKRRRNRGRKGEDRA